ncbi:MAG: Integral rane protein [Thermoleophilia bacterium]|nr:Integral rane protein [Thermoleophilia bacterium]
MLSVSDMQRIESHPDPIFSGDTPSRRRIRRRWLRRLVQLAIVLFLLVLVLPRLTTFVLARGEVEQRGGDLPRLAPDEHLAAIVLGAGLVGERPSPILDDRIEAAAGLLEQRRVDLLLMSGDNTTEYHDEPTVMRSRAIELGAPADQVAADYAGRRTWDTCVRAREVFGIERAVVVTSAFHVDRAVATCRAAGIEVTGLSVSDSEFRLRSRARWRTRELAATGRALLDAWVLRPEPAVGGDAIDPWNPCELRDSLAPSDAQSDDELTSRCD